MALQGGVGWVANGNIHPCRFVKQDTGGDGLCIEAAAASDAGVIGVSQEGTYLVPALGLDQTYAAAAGIPLHVFEFPETCLLEVSAAVTVGALLTITTGGKGVTAGVTSRKYARALQGAGGDGEKILVKLLGVVEADTTTS